MKSKLPRYDWGYAFTYNEDDDNEPKAKGAIVVFKIYTSFKEELLKNHIASIPPDLWNNVYQQVDDLLRDDRCRKKYNGITAHHLLSLILYCDCDSLQNKLTETYREKDNGIHHQQFYHFGKLLKESVYIYGTEVKVGDVFFHGTSEPMLFDLPQSINTPFSTAREMGASENFTNNDTGMILALHAAEHSNNKYFYMNEWLSISAYEGECLFIQNYGDDNCNSPLQIISIIDCRTGTQYRDVVISLNFINQIFNNNIASIPNYINALQSNEEIKLILEHRSEFMKKLIEHKLSMSLSQYTPFESLREYHKNMIDNYFDDQSSIQMDYLQIKDSVYSFILGLLFDSQQMIKVYEMMALFSNLHKLVLRHISLSVTIIETLYTYIRHDVMPNICVIQIIEAGEIRDNVLEKIITEYKHKFAKIKWNLSYTCDNHFLLVKTHIIRRIRGLASGGRRNRLPVSLNNPHNNPPILMREEEFKLTSKINIDNEDESKEFICERKHNESMCQHFHQEHKEFEAQIDTNTYILTKEYRNIGSVFSYGKDWSDDIEAEYKHLKQEVLNNEYANITVDEWNAVCNKCQKILKGESSSKRKNQWSKLLRDNNITLKNLLALKLYTDFDSLQREFRKSFRTKEPGRMEQFYRWREALKETFEKFNKIHSAFHQPNVLFHGINSIMCIDQYKGKYYGPISTTTDLHVARSFAGKNGMVLVMKLKTDKNKVLDISWISDYPDEREYLLFNHEIDIETWILSTDYDEYYHYYHNIFETNKPIPETYRKQMKVPIYLSNLKSLVVDEIEGKCENNGMKIKRNVDFGKDTITDKEKIDLLLWMFEFIVGYKCEEKKSSKYDETLSANIQHIMKLVNTMKIPQTLMNDFIEQVETEMRDNDIRVVFNNYFVNTKIIKYILNLSIV